MLLLLGVTNICQARIGDTLEEAIERYGKPLHKASADEFAMFKQEVAPGRSPVNAELVLHTQDLNIAEIQKIRRSPI